MRVESQLEKGSLGEHMDNPIGTLENTTETIQIGSNLIQGWLRKHIEKSKLLKVKIFPLRYAVLDRNTGKLIIYKKVMDVMTISLETNQLLYCKAINLGIA